MSEDSAAQDSGTSRRRLRGALLGAIAALYLVSVPWYRAPDASPPLWFGLPNWVAMALACYAACALLNAVAWLLTEVPDTPLRDEHGELGGRGS
jgi:hypothetical protein